MIGLSWRLRGRTDRWGQAQHTQDAAGFQQMALHLLQEAHRTIAVLLRWGQLAQTASKWRAGI